MTMLKKNSVADSVAADMADIIGSDEHRTVFAKPEPPVKKEAEKGCDCPGGCECWEKHGSDHSGHVCKCPEGKKSEASVQDQFTAAINSVASISEFLDELGLPKSALYALKTLEVMVAEAGSYAKDDDDDNGKKDDDDDNGNGVYLIDLRSGSRRALDGGLAIAVAQGVGDAPGCIEGADSCRPCRRSKVLSSW